MSYSEKDLNIIRELAKQYMEIAMSDKHVKMRRCFRDNNDLKIVRPPVIMEEIPWHEMNYEHALDCICEDNNLRNVERNFRVALFREKYFKCDNFIEPYYIVGKSYSNTGDGFAIKEERLATDAKNHIVAHHYNDIFEDESALEMYHDPVITPHPENDAANVAKMEEILGDTIPVQLRGSYIDFSPWDRIATLRGVEPILVDIYERPEYLHEIMKLLTRAKGLEMDQMEKYGLVDPRRPSLHCTPSYVTPPTEPDPEHYTCKDIWFRAKAQMFNMVSPEIHDEFDLQYSIPLAKRCAYTYYGCCEPLHDRLDKIKQYPNLRKVGVTPWADHEMCGEQIRGDYVFSMKPNPANVSAVTDPEVIRAEIEKSVKICQKYGCPMDITLKDISTVGYRPENLMVWAQTVSDVLDKYYDAE